MKNEKVMIEEIPKKVSDDMAGQTPNKKNEIKYD